MKAPTVIRLTSLRFHLRTNNLAPAAGPGMGITHAEPVKEIGTIYNPTGISSFLIEARTVHARANRGADGQPTVSGISLASLLGWVVRGPRVSGASWRTSAMLWTRG